MNIISNVSEYDWSITNPIYWNDISDRNNLSINDFRLKISIYPVDTEVRIIGQLSTTDVGHTGRVILGNFQPDTLGRLDIDLGSQIFDDFMDYWVKRVTIGKININIRLESVMSDYFIDIGYKCVDSYISTSFKLYNNTEKGCIQPMNNPFTHSPVIGDNRQQMYLRDFKKYRRLYNYNVINYSYIGRFSIYGIDFLNKKFQGLSVILMEGNLQKESSMTIKIYQYEKEINRCFVHSGQIIRRIPLPIFNLSLPTNVLTKGSSKEVPEVVFKEDTELSVEVILDGNIDNIEHLTLTGYLLLVYSLI
jgi:hypothetical protein